MEDGMNLTNAFLYALDLASDGDFAGCFGQERLPAGLSLTFRIQSKIMV